MRDGACLRGIDRDKKESAPRRSHTGCVRNESDFRNGCGDNKDAAAARSPQFHSTQISSRADREPLETRGPHRTCGRAVTFFATSGRLASKPAPLGIGRPNNPRAAIASARGIERFSRGLHSQCHARRPPQQDNAVHRETPPLLRLPARTQTRLGRAGVDRGKLLA